MGNCGLRAGGNWPDKWHFIRGTCLGNIGEWGLWWHMAYTGSSPHPHPRGVGPLQTRAHWSLFPQQVPSLQDPFKTVKPELSDLRFLKSTCAVQAFMKNLWLLEALTCSRREDDLSCRHGVKPPHTHTLTPSINQSINHKGRHCCTVGWVWSSRADTVVL